MNTNQHYNIMIEQLNNNKTIVSFAVNKINILNSKEIEIDLTNLGIKSNNGLTIDLSNIKFIDSTGFGMLQKIKNKSIDINYINVSSELQELFNLVGF